MAALWKENVYLFFEEITRQAVLVTGENITKLPPRESINSYSTSHLGFIRLHQPV